MKNSKKAWEWFKRIMLLLFMFYLINYFQVSSGNYFNNTTKKTILTEQKIKEFEKDVKNGTFVDIKDYTDNTYVNSENNVSSIGYNIGEKISEFMNIKVVDFFEFIGKFIS